MHHNPVMLNEVLSLIEAHSPHARIVDGTLGLGGYSEAILSRFPECRVIGIDRDTQALALSRERLKDYEGRFSALHANFGELAHLEEAKDADTYVFDLGVSNMQLTLPERGFSFQNDGPLDMRMNPSGQEMSAADLLTNLLGLRRGEVLPSHRTGRQAQHITHHDDGRARQRDTVIVASARPAEDGHPPRTQGLPGLEDIRQQ